MNVILQGKNVLRALKDIAPGTYMQSGTAGHDRAEMCLVALKQN